MLLDGAQRGLFSWALLNAIRRQGPTATYRELLTAARCETENVVRGQVPQLYPVHGSLADEQFLGGRVRRLKSSMRMRFLEREGWEIDAGSVHGLVPSADSTTVAVVGEGVAARHGWFAC